MHTFCSEDLHDNYIFIFLQTDFIKITTTTSTPPSQKHVVFTDNFIIIVTSTAPKSLEIKLRGVSRQKGLIDIKIHQQYSSFQQVGLGSYLFSTGGSRH